jgi:hypothetical protein
VSDYVSDSVSDSMYDVRITGLGSRFYIGHQLKPLINTHFRKNSIACHLVQEIVHGIVRRFVRKIARVDGP